MKNPVTHFPATPIIRAIDRDRWELLIDHSNQFTRRTVRRGFVFDGASIPRWGWRIAGHPMQGDVLASALEHDAEYSAQVIPKSEADSRFRENMKRAGVGFFKRNIFYYAVKFFGGIAWRGSRKDAGKFRQFVTECR